MIRTRENKEEKVKIVFRFFIAFRNPPQADKKDVPLSRADLRDLVEKFGCLWEVVFVKSLRLKE